MKISTPRAAKRKRGRPLKGAKKLRPTSIRLPDDIYDRYCKFSSYTGEDVRVIMRKVLALHAPIVVVR